MKKLKVLVIALLAFAMLATGCAGDKYLKTAKTDNYLCDFYSQNFVETLVEFDNYFESDSFGELFEEDVNFNDLFRLGLDMGVYAQHSQIVLFERHIVSMVDYLCAKNISSSDQLYDPIIDPSSTFKLYEYQICNVELGFALAKEGASANANVADYRAYVLVQATKGGGTINSYLFYKHKDENADLASLTAEKKDCAMYMEFDIKNTMNDNGSYSGIEMELGSGASKEEIGSVDVVFDAVKGCFSYEIVGEIEQAEDGSTITNIKKAVYKYANGAIGVRSTITSNNNGESVTTVWEQLSKDFYSRLKLGYVKNISQIISLETMRETNLAESNSSDKFGAVLTIDKQKENEEHSSLVEYGEFPKLPSIG